MKKEEILRLLRGHLDELRQRFGVKSLAIFGSVARGEAGPDSDIDILVSKDRLPSTGIWGSSSSWRTCWDGGWIW